jgi:alkaline phosphatase
MGQIFQKQEDFFMKEQVYILLAFLALFFQTYSVPLEKIERGFAKNVIILIPDGMSTDGVTLTRWVYNDGKPLNMDEIASGLVRTHNSDTIIADSAPGGTALATGHKTQDKLIGVKPKKATLYGSHKSDEEDYYAPVPSVLELAKSMKKSTGIIATSEIMHATPADFTAHATHRKNYNNITEQQVFQNIDVVFGGGEFFLKAENREDKEDMITALKENNYKIIKSKRELEQLKSGKVWGLFSPKDIPYDIDRTAEPSLADMTKKALELLSKNENGFFLMVEGSKIDWAAHANSPAGLISEIRAFDDAVGAALNFAKNNKDTLVIVTSDHGNGGITIGNQDTSSNYSELPLETFVSTLRNVTSTEENLAKKITAKPSDTAALIQKYFGFTPSAEEINNLKSKNQPADIQKVLSDMLNKRSYIGWTTGGHTGEEVVLYVYADDYKNILSGTVQNSDIALYMAKAMGGDLNKLESELFVPSKNFNTHGITVSNNFSDKNNPQFILTKNNNKYTFFENRNYFEINNRRTKFNGVTVYNGEELFIPLEALLLLN